MADKRMFHKLITEAGKFYKLPHSAQALYFHLNMNADDDGIVEGYNIGSLCKTTEDDMLLLQEKGYIKILNDDDLVYIEDWTEHNTIRPDRKKESAHKELLDEYLKSKSPEEPEAPEEPKAPAVSGNPSDEAAGENMDDESCVSDEKAMAAGKKNEEESAVNSIPAVCPTIDGQMSADCQQSDRIERGRDLDLGLDSDISLGRESNNINNIKGQSPSHPQKTTPNIMPFDSIPKVLRETLTKNSYGVFQNVLLTDEEYNSLMGDKQKYIDKLSCYLRNHPKKHYNDHFATIVGWIVEDAGPKKDSCGKKKSQDKPKLGTTRQYNMPELEKKLFG